MSSQRAGQSRSAAPPGRAAHDNDGPDSATNVSGVAPATDEGVNTKSTLPQLIRRAAVPIVLFWVALTATVNIAVPPLEAVGESHAVAVTPEDAPSMRAMKRVGHAFGEFDSNSILMIVLEGDQPLGAQAHSYYDGLITRLTQDHRHVEHIQNLWADPLTAAGFQSSDGRAAYVQLHLAGDMGEALANESVEAVRAIVSGEAPPPGLHTYVTGPAPLFADQLDAGNRSLKMITGLTFVVITLLLLIVYRSISTALLVLPMVVLGLGASRGVVAVLGNYGVIGISTFAVNLLTALAIAASTDYAIFLVGRYHEGRQNGQSPELAFETMYKGTGHIILGSGLTIAGATWCLSFTRLKLFHTMGPALAVGMIVSVAAALTLAPAIISLALRFHLLEPKRNVRSRGWRRVGIAVVRWPLPILVASAALALVGLLALPGYQPGFNDRDYLSATTPVNVGYEAAARHFSPNRLNPEILMIESDHDLRNPADFLVIDKVAKGIFHLRGVAEVQAITRPLGTPMEHTTIPFLVSMQANDQNLNMKLLRDRLTEMLSVADEMQSAIESMQQMHRLLSDVSYTTHDLSGITRQTVADTNELRQRIADFDDFARPIRSYLSWEPHCLTIPSCWSLRSLFESFDGIDTLSDDLGNLSASMNKLDAVTPQMLTLLPPMITTMKDMRASILTMHSTMAGIQNHVAAMTDNASALGRAFDVARNDDSFYLPPEAFDNPDFKRAIKQFLSPDGRAVRFIITHASDPATAKGLALVDPIEVAAEEAIKGTPMSGSKIFLGGTAATFKDIQDGTHYDLLIASIASLCLLFIVMLVMTRSVIAAIVIVGTVLLSLATAFGLSVVLWQYLIGVQLHWSIIAISVIVLLAVGSDYNLLLVARFKEEINAGINTGIIRAMAGTGAVVTSAGLVFAFTLSAMAISELRTVGQVGTTIALGLLFDTLIVRSFMTPSIAALLGRWFWWPQTPPRKRLALKP
ncbi:putative transport protein MmpL9 [Mycobacterium marinum]|uniref:MMPL/RND family transporter n=1 Tax=Mycobacterium marinum TaxID=1781 RepID=UPI0023517ACF|nr:MMPL family transporter [Mycobacterium marinum]GJO23478.1 putative transport protein MmpL9 [Mycobacterium marinum]